MSINYNQHNIFTSGSIIANSGNFSSLSVNGVGVSLSEHTHTASQITDFGSSVSGLLPANIANGSGIANYAVKWSDSDTLTTGILYDNGNNIGIGTSSPLAKLHIINQNTFQNPNVIIHDSASLASGVGASIILGGKFNTAGSYGDFAEIKSIKESATNNNASASLAFFTTNVADLNERMRITSDGNLGVGTNNPTSRLQVEGGNVVFNDAGGNFDFRVEGDTDNSLLFVDASTDSVGIGISDPLSTLHIEKNGVTSLRLQRSAAVGTAAVPVERSHILFSNYNNVYDHIKLISWGRESNFLAGMLGVNISNNSGVSSEVLTIDNQSTAGTFGLRTYNIPLVTTSGNVIFNETAGNFDFRAEGLSDPNLLFVDASADRVGIGTSSPAYKLDVVGSGNFSQNLSVNGVAVSVNGHVHTPRAVSASDTSGTLTPNSDTTDLYVAEGLTGAITFAIPSGTPVNGQKLLIRLKDNGTARGITWTTSSGGYRAIGVTLPTTTVISKTTYIGCIYNSADSFWDVIAIVTQS